MQWSLTVGFEPSFYLMVQGKVNIMNNPVFNCFSGQTFTLQGWTRLQFSYIQYIFSFQEINFQSFYRGYVCWSMFGFIYMNSAWNLTLSLLLAPQNNHSFVLSSSWGDCALLKGTLMASCWGRKEQHLFCISPDEKLNWRPSGCLFAYLTSRRLPAHYSWIARLQQGRKIAYKFNSFVIEFKWLLTLIFVLHITSLQENSILSGCRCSAALMEWYLFM